MLEFLQEGFGRASRLNDFFRNQSKNDSIVPMDLIRQRRQFRLRHLIKLFMFIHVEFIHAAFRLRKLSLLLVESRNSFEREKDRIYI